VGGARSTNGGVGIMQGYSGKKIEVKRSLGRPELRGQDNTEMNIKEIK